MNDEQEDRYRVMLVCSAGGHLAQLVQLRPWWERHDRAWVSFRAEDVVTSLRGERLYFGYSPTTRNIPNLMRNLFLSIRLLAKERPDVIVSTGAGMAVPFFFLGRLLGSHTVYIEVYDRIDSPTMTGRLVRRVTSLFVLQWERQRKLYPSGVYAGPLY
jgi:UDP-N-acetylglucosamine:LPS N-acetylglucosamine transferase